MKRKEEEARKKEEEKKKKQPQRPQTAPPEPAKKDNAGPVNKIRGAGKITGMAGNLTNLYGIDTGSKPVNEADNYAFDLDGGKDPYAFDLSEKKDPYAFDLGKTGGEQKKKGSEQISDPYSFDLEEPVKRRGGEEQKKAK